MQLAPLLLCSVTFAIFGAISAWPYQRSWRFRDVSWPGVFILIAAVALLLNHP